MKLYALLAALLLANATPGLAQQSGGAGNKTNNNAVDKSIIAGHFEIPRLNTTTGVTEHINVNYAISPAPFSQVMKLELQTPDAAVFTIDMTNDYGLALQWKTSEKNYRYNESIDIGSLRAGDYKLNIRSEINPDFVYSVPFHKN